MPANTLCIEICV